MASFLVYVFSRFCCWVYFRFYFNLSIVGRENIPRRGGFIIASNHSSYFDPILLGVSSPRLLYYLGKGSLFTGRVRRWLFRNLKVIPIRRDTQSPNALKKAIRILREGEPLVIFPEGTRASAQALKEGKRGIGFLVSKTNVPVIPAYIKGSGVALPKGQKRPKRCPITVFIGKPMHMHISTNNSAMASDFYSNIAQHIMSHVQALMVHHES